MSQSSRPNRFKEEMGSGGRVRGIKEGKIIK
jgi:hypothetical protein